MHIRDFICNNQQYFEDFITRSTYHSNAIEGSTLSYAETYALLFNDERFTIKASSREIYEAINHKYAMNYMLKNLEEDISEHMIKKIAQLMNHNIQDINGYRQLQVMIMGAEYLPPAPKDVPQLMMYYVYNYQHSEYDTLFDKIADQHIKFERIHPFSDGNGRTGRLLINYELLRHNVAPIVIHKDNRTEYFEYIANQDIKGLARFIQQLSNSEYKRIKTFANSSEQQKKHSFNQDVERGLS